MRSSSWLAVGEEDKEEDNFVVCMHVSLYALGVTPKLRDPNE